MVCKGSGPHPDPPSREMPLTVLGLILAGSSERAARSRRSMRLRFESPGVGRGRNRLGPVPRLRWLCAAGVVVLGGGGPVGDDRTVAEGWGPGQPTAGPPAAPLRSNAGAADWTLTGPAFGEVRRAAVFRVTLGDAVHPERTVRFTAVGVERRQSFSPPRRTERLRRSGSVTYVPSRWGKPTIADG